MGTGEGQGHLETMSTVCVRVCVCMSVCRVASPVCLCVLTLCRCLPAILTT